MSQLDLSSPIFLNFNSKRFWEISLLSGNKTQIRYGKLVQGVEIDETTQTVVKQHKDTDSCLAYINRVIDTKRIKGYQGNIVIQKQSQPVINDNIGYSINISAPTNIQVEEEEDEEEQKSTTDPMTQCFLQLNTSWNSKFVLLTVNGKDVEEVNGQLGLKKTYKKLLTSLTSLKMASSYFEEKIEEYEGQGYKREDTKYHFYIKETSKVSNDSNQGLAIPDKKQKMNSRKMSEDSHSNISGNSDKSDFTDLSQVSGLDLSFDQIQIDDDENSQTSNTQQIRTGNGKITPNSLGGSGLLEGGVLLAQQVPDDMDPTGWYGSEKMDGVRAIWTGKTFYSRNGNEFYPPPFFIENFPNCTLDGELFTKRDDFQRCVGIVKTKNDKGDKQKDERWKEVTYLVYDAPKLMKPFKDRIKAIQEELPKIHSTYIRALPHVIIKDKDHLDEQLQNTLKKGGEGVMLRQPNSVYEQRRSKTLLKVKCFTDEEATVIRIEKGEGRCANMMGAIVCRMKNGIEFKIGSGFNDAQRQRPPKIGSVITFKYQNLTKENKPRFPIFLRAKVNE